MKLFVIPLIVLISITSGSAYTYFTGYAGSPVSNGSCAATCHGSPHSFTPTTNGWPSTYTPGQLYTIIISHGGNQMSNFNACVLRQSNNTPVGTLQGGVNTATYTHSGEGVGVHGTTNDQTSYTFTWTAPSQGVGQVNLYVAVHEDGVGGPNGGGTYTAGETGIEETVSVADADFSFSVLGSNPVSDLVRIKLTVRETAHLRLAAYTATGEMVEVLLDQVVNPGNRIVTWKPEASSGIYFIKLSSNRQKEMKKVIMLR